jgi:hypothetical protein
VRAEIEKKQEGIETIFTVASNKGVLEPDCNFVNRGVFELCRSRSRGSEFATLLAVP